METSAKTAVRIVHTSWLSINAKSPSSSDAQYLLVNNSSCCPHVLCYISKLNVNDIFLAIAKKLPKDGEGGAAGAGGIRWPELKFQSCWNLLLSWLFKFFSFKTKPLCSIVIIRISGPLREVATLPRALAATNNSCVTRTSELRLKLLSPKIGTCENILDYWSARIGDQAQLVTFEILPSVIHPQKVTAPYKIGLVRKLVKFALHASEHCTDSFILFLLLSRNQSSGCNVFIFNQYHSDELYDLTLEHRVNFQVGARSEHFQDLCQLFCVESMSLVWSTIMAHFPVNCFYKKKNPVLRLEQI